LKTGVQLDDPKPQFTAETSSACTDVTALPNTDEFYSKEICAAFGASHEAALAAADAHDAAKAALEVCERERNCDTGGCIVDAALGQPLRVAEDVKCLISGQSDQGITSLSNCDAACRAQSNCDYFNWHGEDSGGNPVESRDGTGPCELEAPGSDCAGNPAQWASHSNRDLYQRSDFFRPNKKPGQWYCGILGMNSINDRVSSCDPIVENDNHQGQFISYDICEAYGAQFSADEAEKMAEQSGAAALAAARKSGKRCEPDYNCDSQGCVTTTAVDLNGKPHNFECTLLSGTQLSAPETKEFGPDTVSACTDVTQVGTNYVSFEICNAFEANSAAADANDEALLANQAAETADFAAKAADAEAKAAGTAAANADAEAKAGIAAAQGADAKAVAADQEAKAANAGALLAQTQAGSAQTAADNADAAALAAKGIGDAAQGAANAAAL